MLEQLLIGSSIICGTVVIHVLFMEALVYWLTKNGMWLTTPPRMIKRTLVLIAMVLWLVAGLTVSAWLWAGIYLLNGVFEQLETALYFSIVTFTTLGYGDVTVNEGWRILASLTAVNGLIIVGLNTAFLVEALSRINSAQGAK
ncbi:potassium channel family protein [uncultured Paraglaciecola sp.]|uniref:potassium channel family protein n=1 Tax=uncultured Paraglaciecola sp. TaxID=1765024 RepID=UPI00259244CA|nr:potassium channel family protein [uncultured Paraglaciecola sp.]